MNFYPLLNINFNINMKNILASLTLLFSILCIGISYFIDFPIIGLYVGSVFGIIVHVTYKYFHYYYNILFKTMLIINLVFLTVNLFFRDILVIPPIFGSPDQMYLKDIYRVISFFGNEFLMRRSSGISDNIHITSLLILFSVFIYYKEKKKFLLTITLLLTFLSLNFQYILITLIFFIFQLKIIKNFSIVKFSIGFFFFFALFDFIILNNAYYYQISNTNMTLVFAELNYYLNKIDINYLLFGFKPGMIDDPYDILGGYYLPLTDIGIIGIPIQFGVLGVALLLLNIILMFRISSNSFNLLFKTTLISIIHYFSLASFLGLVFSYWLNSYSKLKHE